MRCADVPVYLKGVGVLEASRTVHIRPQVEGILTEVLFEEGDFVEAGSPLMTIDSRIHEAELEIAKAHLATHEAAFRLHSDVTKRMEQLVKDDYVSEVEYEKSRERLESTRAQIEQMHGEIKRAEVNLGYTEIAAPISGYLGEKEADSGNLVTPNSPHPLVTINQITPIEVEFSLPSAHLDKIREKQKNNPLKIKAERPSDMRHPLEGELDFINNTVNPQTGMIKLKGTIPNEDERGWPGEFVRTYLHLETLDSALLVPTEALVMGHEADFLFVLDEAKECVEMRAVQKGIEYKGMTVITQGIEKGERVVTDGQLNLTPGALVAVIKERE